MTCRFGKVFLGDGVFISKTRFEDCKVLFDVEHAHVGTNFLFFNRNVYAQHNYILDTNILYLASSTFKNNINYLINNCNDFGGYMGIIDCQFVNDEETISSATLDLSSAFINSMECAEVKDTVFVRIPHMEFSGETGTFNRTAIINNTQFIMINQSVDFFNCSVINSKFFQCKSAVYLIHPGSEGLSEMKNCIFYDCYGDPYLLVCRSGSPGGAMNKIIDCELYGCRFTHQFCNDTQEKDGLFGRKKQVIVAEVNNCNFHSMSEYGFELPEACEVGQSFLINGYDELLYVNEGIQCYTQELLHIAFNTSNIQRLKESISNYREGFVFPEQFDTRNSGAIELSSKEIKFENVIVDLSKYRFYIQNSVKKVIFENCFFVDGKLGDFAFHCYYETEIILVNCTFFNLYYGAWKVDVPFRGQQNPMPGNMMFENCIFRRCYNRNIAPMVQVSFPWNYNPLFRDRFNLYQVSFSKCQFYECLSSAGPAITDSPKIVATDCLFKNCKHWNDDEVSPIFNTDAYNMSMAMDRHPNQYLFRIGGPDLEKGNTYISEWKKQHEDF